MLNLAQLFCLFLLQTPLLISCDSIVIGDDLGRIKIYDASSLSFINSFQAHSGWIHRILESPFIQNKKNSNYIATCSQDGTVKIWDSSSSPTTPPSDWSLVQTYSNHNSEVFGLEWLDADTLASCGQTDEAIKIWSLSSAQTKKEITVTKPGVYSLKLLNNRKHLAVGGFNPVRDINIYDMNDGSLVASLQGHTASVFDLVQLSDDLLASSSNDATVRIWNLTTSANKFTLQGHTSDEGVIGLKQISSDLLASSSGDSTIKVWNVTTSELVRTLVGHTGSIYWALDLLNNNGQQLVSGSAWGDQAIKVWDMSTGECLQTIQTDSHIWSLVVIGPNKTMIILNRNQLTSWLPTYATEKIVNLSKRSIAFIDARTFIGLSHIANLSLNMNSLKAIDSSVFDDLMSLIDLNLSENFLASIEPNLFTKLQSLFSLNLGFNKLTTLNTGTFNSLPNLHILKLDHNQLTRIEASTFSRLTKLSYLYLNNNNLLLIDRLSFLGLVNLEVVYLASNPVTMTQPSTILQLCLTNPKCSICMYDVCDHK